MKKILRCSHYDQIISRSIYMPQMKNLVCNIFYMQVLYLILLLVMMPGILLAQPLDCEKLFEPASSTIFSFKWREDRCEGFIQENTGFNRQSIRISYFGYGDINGDGPYIIKNNTDKEIDVLGTFLSQNTFYKVVVRLSPDNSISWVYPERLEQLAGRHNDRIGFLATSTGNKNIHRPFTISGSDKINIGIVSNNFQFNEAKVVMRDESNETICEYKYRFKHTVNYYEQALVPLDVCSEKLPSVKRISVSALFRTFSGKIKHVNSDAILIR